MLIERMIRDAEVRRAELLEEAERQRRLKLVLQKGSGAVPRLLFSIGRRMVAWGTELERRYRPAEPTFSWTSKRMGRAL